MDCNEFGVNLNSIQSRHKREKKDRIEIGTDTNWVHQARHEYETWLRLQSEMLDCAMQNMAGTTGTKRG